MANKTLDITTLENWLWEAACVIRGEIDAAKYKDYILPLIFLKRLSDVYEDEIKKIEEESKGKISGKVCEKMVESDRKLVRFFIPVKAHWDYISGLTKDVGEKLTDAVRSIARENEKLAGVIDIKDFNETSGGQRIISDDSLKMLIEKLGKHRLGLNDVEPDILGRAYEYLLRKFAEGSGQSAGEFYSPREVAILMGNILDPEEGEEVYDPCSGSGGLLIKCNLRFKEKYSGNKKVKPLSFYGQEILHTTFAMAKMNMFLHDMDSNMELGDSMKNPKFTNKDGSLRKFDILTANPMWNQDFPQSVYETDTYGRFLYGYPPSNSADWGWLQHMYSCLNDKGRMAVVLDTGAVARGSGNTGKNRERDIRKEFVDKDLVECVILLPENLFYNTSAPGIIIVMNKAKKKGEILLINASKEFSKGRPKNFIPEKSIEKISKIYSKWREEEGLSKVIKIEDAVKNDYNLSPSRYVSQDGEDDTLPLEDAVVLLREAEEERKEADKNLNKILKELGF